MRKPINPGNIAAPASAYHHAVLSQGITDLLTISGQLGERPDGTCAEGVRAQANQAWNNASAILAEAGMNFDNIIKVTTYVVNEQNINDCVSVHRKFVGDRNPPWTLVVVTALGRPHYLVEIEVLAARTAAQAEGS